MKNFGKDTKKALGNRQYRSDRKVPTWYVGIGSCETAGQAEGPEPSVRGSSIRQLADRDNSGSWRTNEHLNNRMLKSEQITDNRQQIAGLQDCMIARLHDCKIAWLILRPIAERSQLCRKWWCDTLFDPCGVAGFV